jgi:hypothetical protein
LPEADKNRSPPAELPINYIKSPQYRETACDGVLGGVTSKNKVWMAFYGERYPLPRVITYEAEKTDDPQAVKIDEGSPPIKIESKQGIIRHVEFSAYLDLDVAKALHKWLGERIAQLEPGKR